MPMIGSIAIRSSGPSGSTASPLFWRKTHGHRHQPKPSLTIKRRFNAPPEKVFAAWTDPEKVKRWMGPGEVKVLRAESDPRAGGRYRWLMQAPDGEEHDVSGVYREFIPNEKLVFTWAWKSTPERESLVTRDIQT